MGKKEFEKFLDNLVLARKIYFENLDLADEISVCTGVLDEGIHVHSGIEKIAYVMGLELTEKVFNDDEYPYKYSLVYDGVEFFQISKEKLGNACREQNVN